MPPRRNNLRSNRPAGHLLLLGCSDRKLAVKGKLPAIELYDGVNFRVLRTFLHERGWPPGFCIKILSAKYGLLDATDLIEPYDLRLDEATARAKNREVLKALAHFGKPSSVFVNLGKDYLPAIDGIDRLFHKDRIVHAEGGIGSKMAHMKRWLNALPSAAATLPGKRPAPSYLYFFPDWDDYVTSPFVHETARGFRGRRRSLRRDARQLGSDLHGQGHAIAAGRGEGRADGSPQGHENPEAPSAVR
jgi:hypothetical protein